MESVRVEEIFDHAFCEVTKKLVNLELQKITEEDAVQRQSFYEGCREEIETHGYMNAMIVCQFSDELYRYIIDTMNNGGTPPEEEIPLYLNEYVNIVCGHAVSSLNNTVGRASRLSVPSFYEEGRQIEGQKMAQMKRVFSYRTTVGMLHVFMFYSLQSD